MKKWKLTAVALALGLVVPLIAGPAIAMASDAGLSPGYWKNHTEAWTIGNVSLTEIDGRLPDITLLEALNSKGNKDTDGFPNSFLRHVAAAWLNAHGVPGAVTPEGLQNNLDDFFDFVASDPDNTRDWWLLLKGFLDEWNNMSED